MATPGRYQHPQSDDEDALQSEDQDIRVCMFKPGNDAPLADLRGCLKRLLGAAVIDHIALVVPDLLRHGGHDELSLESPESKLTALGPHASSSEITIETNDHARSLKHDDHLVVRGVGESRPRPSYLELRQRLSNAEAVSSLHHHHCGCKPACCITLRQPLRRPYAPMRALSLPLSPSEPYDNPLRRPHAPTRTLSLPPRSPPLVDLTPFTHSVPLLTLTPHSQALKRGRHIAEAARGESERTVEALTLKMREQAVEQERLREKDVRHLKDTLIEKSAELLAADRERRVEADRLQGELTLLRSLSAEGAAERTAGTAGIRRQLDDAERARDDAVRSLDVMRPALARANTDDEDQRNELRVLRLRVQELEGAGNKTKRHLEIRHKEADVHTRSIDSLQNALKRISGVADTQQHRADELERAHGIALKRMEEQDGEIARLRIVLGRQVAMMQERLVLEEGRPVPFAVPSSGAGGGGEDGGDGGGGRGGGHGGSRTGYGGVARREGRDDGREGGARTRPVYVGSPLPPPRFSSPQETLPSSESEDMYSRRAPDETFVDNDDGSNGGGSGGGGSVYTNGSSEYGSSDYGEYSDDDVRQNKEELSLWHREDETMETKVNHGAGEGREGGGACMGGVDGDGAAVRGDSWKRRVLLRSQVQ